MKKSILIILTLLNYTFIISKDIEKDKQIIDSLTQVLETSSEDSVKYDIISKLGWHYVDIDNDKALHLSEKSYKYGLDQNNVNIIKKSIYTIAYIYNGNGKYEESIKYFLVLDNLYRDSKDTSGIINSCNGLGNAYLGEKMYKEALFHYKIGNKFSEMTNNSNMAGVTMIGIANAYSKLDKQDSSLFYLNEAKEIFNSDSSEFIYGVILANLGETLMKLNDLEKALYNCKKSLSIMLELKHEYGIASLRQSIGAIYKMKGDYKNALNQYLISLKLYEKIGSLDHMQECYYEIGLLYAELGQKDKGYDFMKKHTNLKDSLFNMKNSKIIAEMQNDHNQEIKDHQIKFLNK